MAAVTGTSRGARSALLYNLHAKHCPRRASSLAWRTRSDDNGLLRALQPINLLFELGDPLLALGQGVRPIRKSTPCAARSTSNGTIHTTSA
jgi:hypothetical protein